MLEIDLADGVYPVRGIYELVGALGIRLAQQAAVVSELALLAQAM